MDWTKKIVAMLMVVVVFGAMSIMCSSILGCAAIGEWPEGPRIEGPNDLVLEYGGCSQAGFRSKWSKLSDEIHWYYVYKNGVMVERAVSFVKIELSWDAFAKAWPEKARRLGII